MLCLGVYSFVFGLVLVWVCFPLFGLGLGSLFGLGVCFFVILFLWVVAFSAYSLFCLLFPWVGFVGCGYFVVVLVLGLSVCCCGVMVVCWLFFCWGVALFLVFCVGWGFCCLLFVWMAVLLCCILE